MITATQKNSLTALQSVTATKNVQLAKEKDVTQKVNLANVGFRNQQII